MYFPKIISFFFSQNASKKCKQVLLNKICSWRMKCKESGCKLAPDQGQYILCWAGDRWAWYLWPLTCVCVCTDQTRLGTWLVDGDLHHRGLLKFALNEENFAHTLVLLVASLSSPWSIMESLQRWTEVLTTHVDRLKLPRGHLQDYRESRE